LDVLLRLMRSWLHDGKLKEAADVAKAAAPYVHCKASLRAAGSDIATMKDDDLAALARSGAARAGVAAPDKKPA
jgi:hypothetical protein